MDSKIKLIIADDHNMFRRGLSSVLEQVKDIVILASVANGKALVQAAKELKPDVVITDIEMPGIDGITAIQEMKAAGLATRSLILSTYNSNQLIVDAMEAGALGYITKNSDDEEIVDAVRCVYGYQHYYCKTTNLNLIKRIAKSEFNPYKRLSIDLLNDREKMVSILFCQQKTAEEMAKILFLSKRTVEGIKEKIKKKIGAKSDTGIAIFAIQNGIYIIE
ncbi:response regulator transcription factor [Parafilimonas terrae]|uniref:Two component transcriptional regulator, LuxR family n=1 Tax=Parafilimonas terrae TaxID=1465490 RepID=A0A1I5XGM9_9BACT|nr:response regulator transcription factor [Parafilimonas terrae]SFQ31110.1 two component transcriptional regulator, LuxR family [Parafilimonas terrae]